MKALVKREKAEFAPITLTITIESQNELDWYQELFNLPKGALCECDPAFRGLIDPDPNGDLNEQNNLFGFPESRCYIYTVIKNNNKGYEKY